MLGGEDVDWYRYDGTDEWTCEVDPTIGVQADATVQVCMFFDCANGDQAQVLCPAGTSTGTSLEGRMGCCSAAGFVMSDFACGNPVGGDDSAAFRVWALVVLRAWLDRHPKVG